MIVGRTCGKKLLTESMIVLTFGYSQKSHDSKRSVDCIQFKFFEDFYGEVIYKIDVRVYSFRGNEILRKAFSVSHLKIQR